MNELEQLLEALGAKSFASALASITNFNEFLTGAKMSTGKTNTAEALAELQARSARADFAVAVEKIAGATGDEALGTLRAAMTARDELPKAQARVVELEKENNGHAFDALLAKATDEKKVTPAISQKARDSFAKGEMTLKQAEFFFDCLPVITALTEPPKQTPAVTQNGELKHEGKTFAELKPMELHNLKKSNPELFAAMHAASVSN